jgi:hypothetical protein
MLMKNHPFQFCSRLPRFVLGATLIGMVGGAALRPTAEAQVSINYSVFDTLRTGSGALTTTVQTFSVDQLQPAGLLSFVFGFSTEERPTAGQFLDAATITFQTPDQATTLVCLTADANGVTWAPSSPGANPLDPNSITRLALTYNDTTAPWTYQVAFSVTLPLPKLQQGQTANLFLDLFDNGDSIASQAWISTVPEPGTGLLVLLAGLLWLARGASRH